MAQVTFNKTYNSGYDGLFNVLPQGTNYWMVMNAHQNPDQSLVCKLDSLGNVILSKSFADTSNSTIIYSLLKDYDSNFISGCYKSNIVTNQSNAFLFKFDVNGDSLWSKTFTDSTGQDLNGNYITLTSDSGYLITGQLWDPVMSVGDYFILKADGVGNFLWSQSFGGNGNEIGYSSIETPDKGFLSIGITRSFGFSNTSNRDELLVKWDSLGNYQWHKTFGTINDEYAICISKLADGNYMLGSIKYNSSTNIQNGKLIKIDLNGNIIWQQLYASKSSFWWLQEQMNSDIVIVGSSRQSNNVDDGLIIRTDSAGNQKWRRHYRFGIDHCYFRDVKETPDGGIICAGFVFDGASGNQDGWLVKLDSTGCLGSGNCGEPTGLFETATSTLYDITVSPNPVTEQAIVKIEGLPQHLLDENYKFSIYSIKGKLVATPRTGFLITDTGIQFIFKRESLNQGIYLLDIEAYSGEKIGVVKVVVQ